MIKAITFILFLTSCAHNSSTYSQRAIASEKSVDSKVVDEYSWIESLDFVKKPEKNTEGKTRSSKQEFEFNSKDELSYALIKESLSFLTPEKLEEGLAKSEDVSTKMTLKCYQNKFDEAFLISDENYFKYKASADYWNAIGTCYFLKLDYAKAILFYNKARDLDSKFAPPINNLGVVYSRQGKYQKALAAFKLASDLNAFSVTPTYNLAVLYLKFGTVGKAMPIFQGLLKRSSNDEEILSAVAASYLLRGDFSKAVEMYSKLSKNILIEPTVGLNYAVALKLDGRASEAKVAFGNLSPAKGSLNEYLQKVEKFIKE